MPKTKSVAAIEGDIDYETFECTNCNHDFLEEDVVSVYLDVDVSSSGCISHRHNCKNIRTGKKTNICENCAESIFSYGRNKYGASIGKARDWFNKIADPFNWLLVIIIGWFLLLVAIQLIPSML